jgi:PHP family Zn ribbon phosphoesterase
MHIIPLSEIIALALGLKQVWLAKVQDLWKAFINRFGNEITVLADVPEEELLKVHGRTAELIAAFRADKFRWIPGGAGIYGVPVPPGKRAEIKYFESRQKSLSDFAF